MQSIAGIRQSVDTLGASLVEGLTILGAEVESLISLVMHLKKKQAATQSAASSMLEEEEEALQSISPRSMDRRRMMHSFEQLGQQLTDGCRAQLALELKRANKDLQSSIAAMESSMRAELCSHLNVAVNMHMAGKVTNSEEANMPEESPSRRRSTEFRSQDMTSSASMPSLFDRSSLQEETPTSTHAEDRGGNTVSETGTGDDAGIMKTETQEALCGSEDPTQTPDTANSTEADDEAVENKVEDSKKADETSGKETEEVKATPSRSPSSCFRPEMSPQRGVPMQAAMSPRAFPLPGMNPDPARLPKPPKPGHQVPLTLALPPGRAIAVRTISPQRGCIRSGSQSQQTPGKGQAHPYLARGQQSTQQLRPASQVSSPYLTTTLADASKMPQQEQEAARLGAMRLAVAQSRPPPPAPASGRRDWPSTSSTRVEI